MVGLFGGGRKAAATPTPVTGDPLAGTTPMPTPNSPASIEAARIARAKIIASSGRSSTALVSQSGTRPYSNSYLGSP